MGIKIGLGFIFSGKTIISLHVLDNGIHGIILSEILNRSARHIVKIYKEKKMTPAKNKQSAEEKALEKKIREIASKLTIPQKTALLHGCSGMELGNIPEAGIPLMRVADGPQGIRLEDGRKTTALPCGMALAATWNPETAYAYGKVIAEDARANDIQADLGPGINLMRTPLNGRNFEYFGEDPVLAGKIGAGHVRGCQDNGISACPKHLALNNQEICRTTGNSICDKKTLRELYLEAFEIIIREAHPWMVMSSYNKINGIYASQNKYTQQDFAKDECGFDGVMVSDWGGTHAAREALRGGLDLEMGGHNANWMFGPLNDQLNVNQILPEELDDHVLRVLRLIFRTCGTGLKKPAKAVMARHGKISRTIGCEASVLLKNDGVLPLKYQKLKRILVCGPSADFLHYTDLVHAGGSGAVHPEYEVTALEAIRSRLGQACQIDYAPGVLFHDAQFFPDELLDSCSAEFYADKAAWTCGKKPFLREKYNTLQLHWGVALAAGHKASNEKLNNTAFFLKLTARFTPKKSGKWQMGLMLSVLDDVTFKIDGKVPADSEKLMRLDNSVALNVKAGQTYELEITGSHFDPELACDCNVLLKPDDKQLCREAVALAEKADAVIYVGGSNHQYDREALGWGNCPADIPDLELPDNQAQLLSALTKVNDNVIVALIGGTVMNVEPWIDSVRAVVDFWYPGQECGNVIVDILTGEAAPEGHLPFTWGRQLQDYACHGNNSYPGVREGIDPHVEYKEGIFIGYRHFDRAGIAPRFPFGFGLSYTSFEYALTGKPEITGALKDKSLKVKVTGKVTNTGRRSGQALVQLYLSQPNCKAEKRPVKVLRNFTKVALKAGETQEFALELSWRDFAFFSAEKDGFVAESGKCSLWLADGESQIFGKAEVRI